MTLSPWIVSKKILVEPDYQTWREYAYKENMHPAILSYLELRNNCFYQMETTIDGKQFATPRGWEDLSRMMEVYERLGKSITADLVGQYIQHERISREFAEYYELYQNTSRITRSQKSFRAKTPRQW